MRVAVLSDVHSNLPALSAVLEDAKDRVDEYWFLGDAIGYGLQPVETLQALAEIISPENMVKGNHEAVYEKEPLPDRDIKLGFEGLLMMAHNRSLIRDAGNCILPSKEDDKKQRDGVNYYLVHSVEHIYNYVYYWDSPQVEKVRARIAEVDFPKVKRSFFAKKRIDVTLALIGHSHLPGVVYLDPGDDQFKKIKVRDGIFKHREDCKGSKMVILNPGSVGFPRDWIPYPSYLILDTKKLVFEFRRSGKYRMDASTSGYDDIVTNIKNYMDGINISRDEAENRIRGLQKAIGEASFAEEEFNLPQDWREFYLESKKEISQVERSG